MGIYVHIPFCRSKCFYCGFYSVVSLQWKEAYIAALCREMEWRKNYLPGSGMESLYLGGGTPSLLDKDELEIIVHKIHETWVLNSDAECSIEMNPEDVSTDKLKVLKELGFNRITIGIQSFNDELLKRINRRHTGKMAVEAVERAVNSGFQNVGIDLIIGLPGSHPESLVHDLEILNNLSVSHVSVYILSIDSNSVFEKLAKKGKFRPLDDDTLAEQYLFVCDYLKNIGFEHYEISNFAKNFKYSKHNTSYWQQQSYIGLGAAAHSYNGHSRQWNVANVKTYIESINNGILSFEQEDLRLEDQYNEYCMTNFRTCWGIAPDDLARMQPFWWRETEGKIRNYIRQGLMKPCPDGRIRMTERGWLLSDAVLAELFVV
ncbi:radical SAM family heme chaperone HemW [Odoribacter sp. Z80]|uniref:radical SAM family heme chaperone HemW n=1 Tax=Odoribacter sp. Z80 TaxID=2304575 RepID=UPI00137B8AFD|nr:radical SAM family heme chaperone HemW [Odoribacter sp. Z80]NCE72222.1 radical SAM family heme chaperone HemW [Odoribacter sp. Z80]